LAARRPFATTRVRAQKACEILARDRHLGELAFDLGDRADERLFAHRRASAGAREGLREGHDAILARAKDAARCYQIDEHDSRRESCSPDLFLVVWGSAPSERSEGRPWSRLRRSRPSDDMRCKKMMLLCPKGRAKHDFAQRCLGRLERAAFEGSAA